MEECAEIDLSEQINNPWSKDTALAIVKGGIYYSVKIKTKDKNDLKKKFLKKEVNKSDKKHNQRVIVIIYCFLLYHLLKLSSGLFKRVKLCNDVSPRWAVIKYLIAICREYSDPPITERIKISFRNKNDKKSKAHYVAGYVAKGRKPATIIFKKQHIDKLKHLIRIFLL